MNVDDVRRRAGENVRRLRIAAGWTQAELAEHVELEPRTIQAIETGHSWPTAATLVSLMRELKAELEEFFVPIRVVRRKPGRPRKDDAKR